MRYHALPRVTISVTVRNELLLRKVHCSNNDYLILVVTRMVTRGNAFFKFEFGAKTVAHAYTLIKLKGMANFQFANEVVYILSLFLNLHSRLP